MNRFDSTELGYSYRIQPTQSILCLKKSLFDLLNNLADHDIQISIEEQNLLHNIDSSCNELLDVYHKIVKDYFNDELICN